MQAILARGDGDAQQSSSDEYSSLLMALFVALMFTIGLIQSLRWTYQALTCLMCRKKTVETADLQDHDVCVHLSFDCQSLQGRRDLMPRLVSRYGGEIMRLRVCDRCLQKEKKLSFSSRYHLPADERTKLFLSTTALKKLKKSQ